MGWGWRKAVTADLARHWRHFTAAAVGIVLGVSALTFFLALGLQVRRAVLDRVFPDDLIEVAPHSADLDLFALRFDLGKDAFGPEDLEALAAVDGVAAVHPKMRLMVPAMASGGSTLFGAGMQTEIVADGIDPGLVDDAAEIGFAAFDEDSASPCTNDADCGAGRFCDRLGRRGGGVCRQPVPVLVSPYVVDLYNGAFRRAYRLPKLNPGALDGLSFTMTFGASSLRGFSGTPVRRKMRLAGISDHAMPLGVTLPIDEIRRLNEALDGPESGRLYHSAVLRPAARGDMSKIIESVEAMGLDVVDHGARRAALGAAALTALLGLVAMTLIAVSTAHIMHVFSFVVLLRRREIGVMRALGARRSDIRRLLLSEAAVVGAAAGAVGVATALGGAAVVDRWLAARAPTSSMLPDTLFAFSPWLVGAVIALAVAACVAGSLPAAARAIAGDPSDALSGR